MRLPLVLVPVASAEQSPTAGMWLLLFGTLLVITAATLVVRRAVLSDEDPAPREQW